MSDDHAGIEVEILRKQAVIQNKAHLSHVFRYGLVVRISGSHPGGPGSIPGNGNLFLWRLILWISKSQSAEKCCCICGQQVQQEFEQSYLSTLLCKQRKAAAPISQLSCLTDEAQFCFLLQDMWKKILPDRESNPGLPRDRRRSSPLDYRGLTRGNRQKWMCGLKLLRQKLLCIVQQLHPISWSCFCAGQ